MSSLDFLLRRRAASHAVCKDDGRPEAGAAAAAAMDGHRSAVAAIAERVKDFHREQRAFRIYHGSTNSTRRSERRRDNTVDTSELSRVLRIDRDAKTATVEPNVPMDTLVEATLPHGLMPQVVMEFPGITVGGGFSGSSGESSSFRFGGFEATIKSIEIVLPTGEVMTASKDEKPDLFWGAASSFGTLGVVTLLEVQLIEAKSYVELTYHLCGGGGEMVERIRSETERPENDYVDAIAFTPESTLICTGKLVDALPPGAKARTFTRRQDPWFYIRAEQVRKRLRAGSGTETDFVPLVDYLFRYDRGAFWTARNAFRYFRTPFNRITRFLLDGYLHTRVMYRAMHQSGLSDSYLVQDVGIPLSRAAEFQRWVHDELGIELVWLCPLRVRREGPDARHGLHAAFADAAAPDLLNFGVWGAAPLDGAEAVRRNRALEAKVRQLGGVKWLYSHAYYAEDEFWAHYDRAAYDAVRTRYGADYLPSVYDKVKIETATAVPATRTGRLRARLGRVWPVRGLYGVYKAIRGGDYLLQKGRSRAAAKKEA